VLIKNPAPTVPATMAPELRRNERRLIELFRRLTLFSKLSFGERFSFLLESFAIGLLMVFMAEEPAPLCGVAQHLKAYTIVTCTRRYRPLNHQRITSCRDPWFRIRGIVIETAQAQRRIQRTPEDIRVGRKSYSMASTWRQPLQSL